MLFLTNQQILVFLVNHDNNADRLLLYNYATTLSVTNNSVYDTKTGCILCRCQNNWQRLECQTDPPQCSWQWNTVPVHTSDICRVQHYNSTYTPETCAQTWSTSHLVRFIYSHALTCLTNLILVISIATFLRVIQLLCSFKTKSMINIVPQWICLHYVSGLR